MQLKCKSCSGHNLYHPPTRKAWSRMLRYMGLHLFSCPACRSRSYYFAPSLDL